MDRQMVYNGAIPLETDLLNTNKNAMVGLAKLSSALLGNITVLNGFTCIPTVGPSLQVQLTAGEVYSLQNIDSTAFSSLAADTTHQIIKQGILLDTVLLTTVAPGTAGQSINYLVQVAYQDLDSSPVVLPYYNASNPAVAYSGPANAGTTNNTVRKGAATVTIKAGVAATTGSQITPAPDAGNTGMFVVTVANGQSTITGTSIATLAGAPFITENLLQKTGQSSLQITATGGGTSDAITASYTPVITVFVNGMVLYVRATAANTSATPTLAVNGLPAKTIVKGNNLPLVAGDISGAGHWIEFQYDSIIDKLIMQNPATGVAQATNSSVVGNVRNLKAQLLTAGVAATFTADEVILETALGGTPFKIANLNKTITISGTGAGGMDTGTAPVSGFVALYAIYNPTTQVSALLATNATAALQSNIYSGVNMPSGYTYSALISVWPTNASSQFVIGMQNDRVFAGSPVQALNTASPATTTTSLSISGAAPKNAKSITGYTYCAASTAGNYGLIISSESTGTINQIIAGGYTLSAGAVSSNFSLQLITAQTMYYSANVGSGATFGIYVNGYTI